jgi:polysaccharide export outer membrane protein
MREAKVRQAVPPVEAWGGRLRLPAPMFLKGTASRQKSRFRGGLATVLNNLPYMLLLGAVFLASTLLAQDNDNSFKIRTKESTISSSEMIRRFEGPIVASYTLGEGDEITVEIWNHPELSGKHVVGPDGKITVPVSGVLAVAGLTREDTQTAITGALGKYYSDLAVTVRVDKYTSYRIFILGRVSSPGALQFESQPTLLDVVTRAGGLPIGGVGADKAGLGRCAIIRRDEMVWVDLKNLVSRGNLSLNIRLSRNDLVYMPDAGDQLIYMLGEVLHPGAFRLTPDMSFLDAFTQAGGLTDDASRTKIEVIRSSTGVHRELVFNDLLATPEKVNVALEEGDIIFIPKRNLAKFSYIMQKLSPVTGFALLTTVLK